MGEEARACAKVDWGVRGRGEAEEEKERLQEEEGVMAPINKYLKAIANEGGKSKTSERMSDSDFLEASKRYIVGEPLKEIAADYGVKPTTLRNRFVRNGVKRGENMDQGLTRSVVDTIKREQANERIECEDIHQSYRQNLAWAIDAAGHYLRTKEFPATCPNNSAYFLLQQALDSPKEFMTKVNQIEGRKDEEDQTLQAASKRAIEEIDAMLATLLEDEGEEAPRRV